MSRIERHRRLQRRITMVVIMSAVLYVLLGVLLACQVYAQERNGWRIRTDPLVEPVPTGSSTQVVEKYYDYLYLRHLYEFQEAYFVNPRILSWIYGFLALVLMLFYFLVYSWYSRRTKEDLYPVEVYNGYIAERGGPVDAFNWAVYSVLIGYAAYYITVMLVWGQNY